MKHEVMMPCAHNFSLDLIETMIRSTIYLKALWEDNYKKASEKRTFTAVFKHPLWASI